MIGFPSPYPEELLYSTIARSGVHDGETSPKQLLEKVFKNRKVIATLDLPSHLQVLANQYPKTLGMNVNVLINRHTLWPIYAPFLPPERNHEIIKWMSGRSKGAVHLASGIIASRVKTKGRLYVCAECLKEQIIRYGECFLSRHWQVPLIKTCPKHASLSVTTIVIDGEHRHTYTAIGEVEVLDALEISSIDKLFSQQVAQLMQVKSKGISSAQWTTFYKQFASSQGYLDGRRIDHVRIHNTVITFWGKCWLDNAGILPSDTETSWLKGLFRKHRKSFSFAEHIVAIVAISNGAFTICDAIEKASNITTSNEKSSYKKELKPIITNQLSQDQIEWKEKIEQSYPKAVRIKNKALYARLYRNNYDWLMQINRLFHAEKIVVNKRVDWKQRDRKIARELYCVYGELCEDLNAPHLSRTFLIHQLEQRGTVEKHLNRLPRCSTLLCFYSESITEYQSRRLTRAYLEMQKSGQEIKRWILLRQAGLSDDRMTDIVADLLKEMLSE
ncbi:TnsD family transposase [Vibrio sp. 1-Bac 57]|uniref:TnsD family Tn7-like transposition protein n=1 Tax=Psychromonas arctica TaxID=168275 RepID=UPI0003F7B790|nr:TnsD family Tn7-like transposition protein [Psychromonas arctica]